MNENVYLTRTVREQLESGLPLVLVSIMSYQGSTPRHLGAKMVVGVDGKSYGTIGGSLIEAAAIRESKEVFTTKQSRILSYELTGKDATAPGMICGGTAEILLDYIPAIEENQVFAGYWHDTARHGKDFYFLTQGKGLGGSLEILRHAIIYSDGTIIGNSQTTDTEIESVKPELHNISSTSVLKVRDTWMMVDRIRKIKTLYCFGAGHVAVPTVHIAAMAGFRVVVIDDRSDFANEERFPDTTICVVDDLNHAFEGLEIDEDSFIVIVTRGHQYDRAVLEQALKTKAGYIGMISSRRKREAIYQALLADGADIERLKEVHSPIGIDIGGETPEEIAVSIVAELIQVRSRQNL